MKKFLDKIIYAVNKYKIILLSTSLLISLIVLILLFSNYNNKQINEPPSEEEYNIAEITTETGETITNESEIIQQVETDIATQTQSSSSETNPASAPVQAVVSGISGLKVEESAPVITSTNETSAQDIISKNNLQAVVNNSIKVGSESELFEDLINQILNGVTSVNYYYPGDYEENAYTKLLTYESIQNPIKDKEYVIWMLNDASQRCSLYTGKGVAFSIITFNISYKVTPEMEDMVDSKVAQAVSSCNSGTTFQKIKNVYEYVMNTITYDQSLKNHTVYDALVSGSAVCDAYSLSMYRILSEMGINCRFVASTDHAWDIVEMDGLWYNIDSTWDDNDEIYKYNWFLKSNNDFPEHVRTADYTYSQCTMSPTSYVWY